MTCIVWLVHGTGGLSAHTPTTSDFSCEQNLRRRTLSFVTTATAGCAAWCGAVRCSAVRLRCCAVWLRQLVGVKSGINASKMLYDCSTTDLFEAKLETDGHTHNEGLTAGVGAEIGRNGGG